jgi:hypothetical protein
MAPDELFVEDIDPRLPQGSANKFGGVFKIGIVKRMVVDKRDHGRYRRSSSAGSTHSLLVVFTHGRDVSETHRGKRPDIDANLHGGGATEDVDGLPLVTYKDVLEAELIFLRC